MNTGNKTSGRLLVLTGMHWLAFLGVCLTNAAPVFAEIGSENFSAYATLTSDYRFRGISQSARNPAIQGGVDFQHGNGIFAGVWASTIDFTTEAVRSNPRDIEINYYLGFNKRFASDWEAVLSVVRYAYPDTSFNYDYTELLAGIRFRDRVGLTVAHAEKVLGHDAPATDFEIDFVHPLGHGLETAATAGYYDIGGAFGQSYAYWNLGLSKGLGRITADVRYHDTSSKARRIFGNDATRDAVVVSLTASF